MPDNSPRTAIVSGVTGDIGRVVAETFAARGCRLVLPVRSETSELRRSFPDAEIVPADLTDPTACHEVATRAEAALGHVDALVNVAGGFAMHEAVGFEPAELEAQLDLNLRTTINLTTAVLPAMVRRGAGAVLGTSAGQAETGGARLVGYATSKAALEGYLKSVRAELEPKGLCVSLLIPAGTVDTEGNRAAMPNADRSDWIDPAALAEAAWFLASRRPGGRVASLRVGA